MRLFSDSAIFKIYNIYSKQFNKYIIKTENNL